MKKFLAITLAALMLLCLTACGEEDKLDLDAEAEEVEGDKDLVFGDFLYAVNDEGDYEITGYTYNGVEMQKVTVPSEINSRPVTGIGADAFKACKTLESVTIPASVKYIGNYAFYDCDKLAAITLPDSVTSVGKGAFQGCDTLASVGFGKGVTAIGDFAFLDCKALTDVLLPEGLLTIGKGAFKNCAAITKITVPTTVTAIGDGAFYNCKALAEAHIMGSKLDSFGAIVFDNCAAGMTVYTTEGTKADSAAKDAGYIVEATPAKAD